MFGFWGSKNRPRPGVRLAAAMLAAIVVFALGSAASLGCDCDACATQQSQTQNALSLSFFTNYGEYMPRMHCIRTADGTPDWYWIIALIGLNAIIIAGYLRIFVFWTQCYLQEQPCDRNRKLMQLAWVFAMCALCGYGLSIVIFFWPVYRLLAIALLVLSLITWRFAFDLEPFRQSFGALRLQRQLNEALQHEHKELEAKHKELETAHLALAETTQELRKTNADMDEFVYAASHDLKAPLRAIDSLAGFVMDDLASDIPEQSSSDLTELRGRVRRMERMLNGLLDYSRMRRLSFDIETFEVSDAIDQAIAVLDIPEGFRVTKRPTSIVAIGPRPPLELVLRNFVDNAVKHHHSDRGNVQVSSTLCGDWVKFEITDDGPGIDPEFHEQVFGMFQTLHRRDEVDTNGMGLALVKRTVESHGGTVALQSEPGQGATFTFTWPLELRPEQQVKNEIREEDVCHV